MASWVKDERGHYHLKGYLTTLWVFRRRNGMFRYEFQNPSALHNTLIGVLCKTAKQAKTDCVEAYLSCLGDIVSRVRFEILEVKDQ